MTTRKPVLSKVLRYHLPLAVTDPEAAMQSTALHWQGFTWRAGPVIVKWFSDVWGELQVWAENEAEGRRVILHALSHMGAEVDSGEWFTAVVENKRNGRIGTVRATMASARPSAGGVLGHLPIL